MAWISCCSLNLALSCWLTDIAVQVDKDSCSDSDEDYADVHDYSSDLEQGSSSDELSSSGTEPSVPATANEPSLSACVSVPSASASMTEPSLPASITGPLPTASTTESSVSAFSTEPSLPACATDPLLTSSATKPSVPAVVVDSAPSNSLTDPSTDEQQGSEQESSSVYAQDVLPQVWKALLRKNRVIVAQMLLLSACYLSSVIRGIEHISDYAHVLRVAACQGAIMPVLWQEQNYFLCLLPCLLPLLSPALPFYIRPV